MDESKRGEAKEPGLSQQHEAAAQHGAPAAAKLHLWQIQGVRDVVVIVAVFAIIWIGYSMRSVTVPLLIALALAYLFEPVVQWMLRFRGITRTGAVTLLLLIGGGLITLFFVFAVPLAIGQSVALVNRLRAEDFSKVVVRAVDFAPEQYRDDLREAIESFRSFMGSGSRPLAGGTPEPEPEPELDAGAAAGAGEPKAIASEIDQRPKEPDRPEATARADEEEAADDAALAARERLEEEERIRMLVRAEIDALGLGPPTQLPGGTTSSSASWRLLGALGTTAERVTALFVFLVQLSLIAFLIPFYFWFFSVSFPKIVDFGRSLIPEKNRERTLELVGMMDRAVSGFVRGRIVICVLMGVMFAIGWLLCGVPYAITVGLFVGAISLVPYLGGIGLPLAVGLLLFDQVQLPADARMAWWAILFWPSLVFVVVQTIESYVLTPMIAGKATDLDPVTIVVAIIAGGAVAGVYGMLLAIPAAACGKILLIQVVLPRIRAWSRGEASDPLPLQALDEAQR
jgi:predicted PurR-regulated permease PerM